MKVVIGILALLGIRWLWVYGTVAWDYLRPTDSGLAITPPKSEQNGRSDAEGDQ